MHTNMKVLQELGIKVVAGDTVNSVNITSEHTEFYNEIGELYDFVSGFAWRDNNGMQPVGNDVVVEVMGKNILPGAGLSGDWDWFKTGASGDICKWRPCLKSLAEVATATPKPKLPVVIGGEYEYSWTGNVWHPCTIIDIGEVGHTVRTANGLLLLIDKEAFGFRFIKSERDITIDAMIDVGFSYGASTRSMMATLYDLGYRKT